MCIVRRRSSSQQPCHHLLFVTDCCFSLAEMPPDLIIISTLREVRLQQLILECSLCAKFCMNEWMLPQLLVLFSVMLSTGWAVTDEQLRMLRQRLVNDGFTCCLHNVCWLLSLCADLQFTVYCIIDCLTNTVELMTVYPTYAYSCICLPCCVMTVC